MSGITRRSAAALLSGSLAVAATSEAFAAAGEVVEQWGVHEIVLEGPRGGNPFAEVRLSAEFTDGAAAVRVFGFYDGEGVYRIRFCPPSQGRWRWRSLSNVRALARHAGSFTVGPPGPGNHGPVRVAGGYHFAHADGAPFRQLGTTAYSWAQQGDARCDETLEALAASPFNKIRMCVFPNVAAEPIWPFEKIGPGAADWDFDRFDPAFFRRFEDRVARLSAIGVQADVILFHPYDETHGFNAMTPARDDAYVRYLVARLSAYRNAWWSLANEHDLIKGKTTADFDRMLQLIQAVDPYDRLRSIHNWRELYDHNKPWITHASIQNGSAVLDDARAEIFRSVYRKPVIFDEVRYEGDGEKRWGDLSPQQLVSRFWHGLVAGTYVGHGEAYLTPGATQTGSWVGKGGRLRGLSGPRLAFLETVMAAGPRPGFEPIDKGWDHHLGGRAGHYYLRYFGEAAPTDWVFALPKDALVGGERFGLEVLDTWAMTVTPVAGQFTLARKDAYFLHDPARPRVALPGRPWMAVRATRIT